MKSETLDSTKGPQWLLLTEYGTQKTLSTTDQAGRVISTLEQTFCPFAGLGCWELFHLGGMLVYMEDLSTFFRDIYFFLSKYFSISCSYFHVINCHRVLFQTSTVKTLGNSSNQDLKFSVSLVLWLLGPADCGKNALQRDSPCVFIYKPIGPEPISHPYLL